MVVCLPNSREGTKTKVEYCYDNRSDNIDIVQSLSKCDSKGPLAINIVKLYNNEQMGTFYAFGRIISGTIKSGEQVKVLGENYTIEEQEDMVVQKVQKLWILQAGGRFKIEVDKALAGSWIAIEGIDQSITKTATITSPEVEELEVFKKLDFNSEASIKVACEPLNPSELPKMIEGLRKINKSYPLASTKVEESGEHIIIGTGELYID